MKKAMPFITWDEITRIYQTDLSAYPDLCKYRDLSNGGFNVYIKEVSKLAGIVQPIKFSHKKGNKDIIVVKPKYAWVISHTCRRSFCTNEFLSGAPVDLIMKISGHKSLRDFYRYIRITPE